jgi:hypothetical protein
MILVYASFSVVHHFTIYSNEVKFYNNIFLNSSDQSFGSGFRDFCIHWTTLDRFSITVGILISGEILDDSSGLHVKFVAKMLLGDWIQ